MGKESEVRFSYSSLPVWPVIACWGNKKITELADRLSYDSVEFLPLRGAAKDVINNIEVVASLEKIKSGHVHFNPYATSFQVLTRKPDPLRPGKKLGWYNLLFAEPNTSINALRMLERVFTDFPVVTYPYKVDNKKPYGEYKNPWVQTHPAVFNDESTADDLIRQVRKGEYKGVVWDIYHALEATEFGKRPLKDWSTSLGRLLEAGVLREIHISPGRIAEKDPSIDDIKWLRALISHDYDSDIGKMIKLIKDSGQNIPFVAEISVLSLIKNRLVSPKAILRTTADLQEIHGSIVDFIKRV